MENLEKIYHYWLENNYIPSYSKMCEIFWVKSKSWVFKIVNELVEEWYLEKKWNIIIPTEIFTKFWFPVVWEIRAGFPSPAEQFEGDRLNLDSYLVDNPNDTILVNVKWDSMEDFWIYQGDIVVVRRWQVTKEWDIVIAEVDWEFTLKKLAKKNGEFYLLAWNVKYPPIEAKEELSVHWKVAWVVRKY